MLNNPTQKLKKEACFHVKNQKVVFFKLQTIVQSTLMSVFDYEGHIVLSNCPVITWAVYQSTAQFITN